jgi:hypothetical protein
MLIAGRGSGNTKAVGDVMVYTHASFPRNLTPSTDGLSDLGRSTGPYGAKRWKDLHLSGGVIRNARGVITDTTIALTDYYVQVSNTGGATIVLLPSAVTAGAGREFVVKNLTANTVTLTPILSQTIDTLGTFVLDANPSAATIISDGLNWSIIGTHGVH